MQAETRKGELEVTNTAKSGVCRSCRMPIWWVKTAAGKDMPVSVKSIEFRDNKAFGLSHFADCPDAKSWKR